MWYGMLYAPKADVNGSAPAREGPDHGGPEQWDYNGK